MKNLVLQVQTHKQLHIFLLFFPFMYVQFVLLRLGNSAGRGFLPDAWQEYVYCGLQVVVIAGFLLHAALFSRVRSPKARNAVVSAALILCAAGGLTLLFLSPASVYDLIVTGVTVFLLGWIGGAVYLKASLLFGTAKHAGLLIGIGYAAAVALQFFTQLQWNVVPALTALLLLSFACLFVSLTGKTQPEDLAPEREALPVSGRTLVSAVAVTASFLTFTVYYTGYIHHLQILSDYGAYNVYTWPRLMMIPVVLLFGRLGDVKNGKLLPIGTFCVAVVAFLNTVLVGRETYTLNMCLYYVALACVIVYYHLTFLRLAPSTKRPALWACMGRLLDSAVVLFSFVFRVSVLPTAAVLAVDIALLVLAVLMMALNKDFSLEKPALQTENAPARIKADPFPILQARFGITPAEMNVLRELVLTEDKQDVIADRLNISVSTVRHHITSIYRKTDVQSRAGLCKLTASCES